MDGGRLVRTDASEGELGRAQLHPDERRQVQDKNIQRTSQATVTTKRNQNDFLYFQCSDGRFADLNEYSL